MWKEEIWRKESKSDFGYGKLDIPTKYPEGTIKQPIKRSREKSRLDV